MAPEHRPGDGPSGLLPQLRLDDLLAELQARMSAAVASRDRVHALLKAVVSIEGDLDLETVLRRIVEAAAGIADARYAALGVIGEDGRLARFIPVGMNEEEIAAIGHWPKGRGLLGKMIMDPRRLRLADIAAHPASSGFPPGHPPMRAFLGVPIQVHDQIFGSLFLTEKAAGGEFDEDDETMVAALSAAAGVAIENARLYQEARRRERWLEASAEVSTSLLSGTDPDEVLAVVAQRARSICDAAYAAVLLVRGGELVVEAADGWGNGAFVHGRHFPIDEVPAGKVIRSGRSLSVADAAEVVRRPIVGVPVGPLLVVPLGTGTKVRGVLVVAHPPGGPVFGGAARRLLEPFATQAAVALELAERRRDVERLVVLEERDRIAKDLHDTVIQRLFATGMTLMGAARMVERSDVGPRLRRAIDDLDDTVRRIRSTIFALQMEPGAENLRARLHRVVGRAAEGLGFAPAVRLDGLIDTEVDDEVGDNLLAVLEEGLSNVVRHARARRVSVAVDAGKEVLLTIVDDGVGMAPGGRRSGLRNMAERAEGLGGSLTVGAPAGGGTRLEWRVPARLGEPTGP